MLFEDGLHSVTGIKNNMKNRPMTMRDKILPGKRSVIKTINDESKNICEMEHSRHRSPANFPTNPFAGLAAYGFLGKKPAIKFERSPPDGQIELFRQSLHYKSIIQNRFDPEKIRAELLCLFRRKPYVKFSESIMSNSG
jgi:hypothetical protein